MTPPRGKQEIVEREARSWEARRLAEQRHPIETPHPGHGPWISISRQLGSHGAALASRLSQDLGWTTYDREIVARIAAEQHIGESVVREHDEHASGVFDDYLSSLMIPHDQGQAAYIQQLKSVVGEIARAGNAVLVGRGVNWFLNGRYGLRLRVHAPLDQRVATVAARESISAGLARRKVLAHDAERRAFVRQVYKREIDDPEGYDFVLNLGSLDLDVAAAAVIGALRKKFEVR